jgi:hypothetical protein
MTSVSNFKDQNGTGTVRLCTRKLELTSRGQFLSVWASTPRYLSRSHTIFRVTINYSPPPTVHYFDEPPAPTPAVKIIHHETRLPVHQKRVDGALNAGKELGVGERLVVRENGCVCGQVFGGRASERRSVRLLEELGVMLCR